MKRQVIKKDFWSVDYEGNGDHNLYADEIGWSKYHKADAKSDYPEYIFRYYIDSVGFNLLFYWLEDGCFYTIQTERDPIEVHRIFENPDWNGKYEFQKAGSIYGPDTSSDGEVIATFDNPSDIWDNLRIKGVPIGKVLENSVILKLD